MNNPITFEHKGDFSKTTKFLDKMLKGHYIEAMLRKYGARGVEALSSATPVDTGKTASSWNYEVIIEGDVYILAFNNTNLNKGENIAILLDRGHGTRNGGYVRGRNFIRPAIRPIFDQIAKEAWGEVVKS